MKKNSAYYLLIILLLAADQLTKFFVTKKISLYISRTVIPGFFNITYIRNKGAIFGTFSQVQNRLVFLLLTGASFVALALVIYYFVKTPPSERLAKVSLSLILAGALGNLSDRIFRGYVVDFLDLYIKGYHWPFFNVADSCITVGALLLLFILFFKRKLSCSPSS